MSGLMLKANPRLCRYKLLCRNTFLSVECINSLNISKHLYKFFFFFTQKYGYLKKKDCQNNQGFFVTNLRDKLNSMMLDRQKNKQ